MTKIIDMQTGEEREYKFKVGDKVRTKNFEYVIETVRNDYYSDDTYQFKAEDLELIPPTEQPNKHRLIQDIINEGLLKINMENKPMQEKKWKLTLIQRIDGQEDVPITLRNIIKYEAIPDGKIEGFIAIRKEKKEYANCRPTSNLVDTLDELQNHEEHTYNFWHVEYDEETGEGKLKIVRK